MPGNYPKEDSLNTINHGESLKFNKRNIYLLHVDHFVSRDNYFVAKNVTRKEMERVRLTLRILPSDGGIRTGVHKGFTHNIIT
jgi:hypothetical protein